MPVGPAGALIMMPHDHAACVAACTHAGCRHLPRTRLRFLRNVQGPLPPIEQKVATQTEDILNSILPPRCVSTGAVGCGRHVRAASCDAGTSSAPVHNAMPRDQTRRAVPRCCGCVNRSRVYQRALGPRLPPFPPKQGLSPRSHTARARLAPNLQGADGGWPAVGAVRVINACDAA